MPPIRRRPATGRGISHVVDEESVGAPCEELFSMPLQRGQGHIGPLLEKLARVFPDETADGPFIESDRAERVDDWRIVDQTPPSCPR